MKRSRTVNGQASPGQVHENSGLKIELDCQGRDVYAKYSFPVKYGRFSRLETRDHIFEFNLNHEIRHARGKTREWLHPSEWLKRTMGDDWVYYSTGGYSGVFEAIGEYYLPNLTYPTNSLLGGKPFTEPAVAEIVNHWQDLLSEIDSKNLPARFARWFENVQAITPDALEKKANDLMAISGERITVMPPDARHVDYNIIPITIADGCLYKCKFCRVKNKKPFAARSKENIREQIHRLKKLFDQDIINYNAVFLREHDALNAPAELIIDTVKTAKKVFRFDESAMTGPHVFMFGSVDALLDADPDLFKRLNCLGMTTYINIGLESYDPATLEKIGKPLSAEKVLSAFKTIQTINDTYPLVEITANFIMDESLDSSHTETLLELARHSTNRTRPKGTLYLSPLSFAKPSRQVLYDFYRLKTQSRFPTFLYIIQRL